MGLIDLKTDLKSLKYGKDRPGGNSSGQPYIQTPIPDENTPQNFFVRAGALQSDRRLKDVERLSKFFADNGNGLRFVTKMNLLSRLSVNTEASNGSGYGGDKGGINQGIYTPTSTLIQAGVQGLGTENFNLLGLSPISDTIGGINRYETIIKSRDGNDKTDKNRLIKLFKEKLFTQPKDNILLDYPGGPGSFLGIGKTEIKRTTFSVSNFYRDLNETIPGHNSLTFDMPLLNQTKDVNRGSNQRYGPYPISEIYDFRQTIKEKYPEVKALASTDYTQFNREKTYGLGNPGKRGLDRSDPYFDAPLNENGFQEALIDKTNAKPISYSTEKKDFLLSEDLIEFHFSAIDNDNPEKRDWVQFRAFLEPITDSFTPEHNSTRYVGRGENFYKYTGFDRQLSFGFNVAVQSRLELNQMYEKLNYLASLTMPDYSLAGFMRGNLLYLTIGNYLNDVPGVISSLTYNISEDSPWEIGRDGLGNRDTSLKQLPHLIKVSMNFKPVHNFLPRRSKSENITEIINYV